MNSPRISAFRIGSVIIAVGSLTGCLPSHVDTYYEAEASMTPESLGISTSTWLGKSCEQLQFSYNSMAEMQRISAETGDVHSAKVRGWQLDTINQVRGEQGCITGASVKSVSDDFGLTLENPSAELVKALGLKDPNAAWVVGVAPGSAADKAGIRPMDVIQDLSGQLVRNSSDVMAIARKLRPGYKASLSIWRNRANHELVLDIPDGLSASVKNIKTAAVGTTAPASVDTDKPQTQQSDTPAGAMYCTAVLGTQRTNGATASPVKLIAGAANDMQPSLKGYIDQVKKLQPGIWGDFKINTAVCAPGAVVCMAEAKGPTGKVQNAFEFCHTTQAKADAQLSQMREADPQAVVVDWP